mmetsp:Transcript_35892/g.94346  ORF Transcript_35892/g.94346 Transcript_35892/m.94346 type:complete len:226 (+) Transcript_35892:4345-5022(+)
MERLEWHCSLMATVPLALTVGIPKDANVTRRTKVPRAHSTESAPPCGTMCVCPDCHDGSTPPEANVLGAAAKVEAEKGADDEPVSGAMRRARRRSLRPRPRPPPPRCIAAEGGGAWKAPSGGKFAAVALSIGGMASARCSVTMASARRTRGASGDIITTGTAMSAKIMQVTTQSTPGGDCFNAAASGAEMISPSSSSSSPLSPLPSNPLPSALVPFSRAGMASRL